MKSDEIRETTFLSHFPERRGFHLRVPSASLVPPPDDTTTPPLTVAGMQPLKPYFEGREEPPRRRLTSSQRSFRTVDIEVVGSTKRHLTFFEMLGNLLKPGLPSRPSRDGAHGWELSLDGFRFDPERIWVTVFEGDDELGPRARRRVGRHLASASDRRPRGADRRCRGRRTSGGRRDRPLRAVLGDVHRPWPRLRSDDERPGDDTGTTAISSTGTTSS